MEKLKTMLKNPVTTVLEKSETETLKKGLIKTATISLVLALVSLLSTVIRIMVRYSGENYSYLTSSELAERRADAFANAELFTTFIQSFITIFIVIAVMGLILFLIAKFVKSPKKYESMLSMVTNVSILYGIGSIINTIFSFIYAPIGMLIFFIAMIYSSYTLIYAFRDSLEIENSNNLVIVTTIVFTVILLIAVILIAAISGVSINSLMKGMQGISELTNMIEGF